MSRSRSISWARYPRGDTRPSRGEPIGMLLTPERGRLPRGQDLFESVRSSTRTQAPLSLRACLSSPGFRVPTLLTLVCSSCIWRGSALTTLADRLGEFRCIRIPPRVRTNARKNASVVFCDTSTISNGGDVESLIRDII